MAVDGFRRCLIPKALGSLNQSKNKESSMKNFLLMAIIFLIGACSDSVEEKIDTSYSEKYSKFPSLPVSGSQAVELMGAMSWWFWEGDGGCFGTITDGRQSIELHAEADLCEPIEYEEGQEAVIKVIYDPEKQYAPDGKKMYSIVSFGT